jgi:transcriptional regulator with XRE-family HTH domain
MQSYFIMASAELGATRGWSYDQRAMVGRPTSRKAPPFGAKLARLRELKGLTQVQLAERLGVSQSLIAYYERRATNPSLSFIEKAASVLGVGAVALVGDESTAPPKKRPGPVSQLDERFEKVRHLPKAKQALVVRMIDAVLAGDVT